MSRRKSNRFRQPEKTQGKRFQASDPRNYDEEPVIFSLRHVQAGDYCFSELDAEHKAAFAEAVFKRKEMAWSDVKRAPRHGLGTEKIAKWAIREPEPSISTPDSKYFLALRYHGMHPVVGFRQKDVFYVLWFDHRMKLYDHGS